MRLLLVEDDRMIGAGIQKGLHQDGFTVEWIEDGTAAKLALEKNSYDLLLLDLGLPGIDGLDLLAEVRRTGKIMPVLVITARDAVSDRIQGLDVGADDYLVKPFELGELSARVRALLRRASGRSESDIQFANIALYERTRRVTLDGESVDLTPREFDLLRILIEQPGLVLTRAQLEERLYGGSEGVESNLIEVYVHGLRKKLGTGLIKTIRGLGYMATHVT